MMRRLAKMGTRPFTRLAGDRRGSTTAEFVLTLPIWGMLIFGILTTARVYNARAGVLNGLGEAARVATLWPARPNADITAAFNQRTFGLLGNEQPTLAFAPGINNGQNFVDLTVTFTPQIDLFLIEVEPVTLTYTRRAFRPS
jgi:Flp pilus assembly protein TadG